MARTLSVVFAILSSCATTLLAIQCTSGWLYPALGTYYNGTINVGIRVFDPKCSAQSGFLNATYPGLLYIGQPAGVRHGSRGDTNQLEATMVGWGGGPAPCSRSSPEITVDFNTSDHTLVFWSYEVAQLINQTTHENIFAWDIVAGPDIVAPLPPDAYRQFEMTVPQCAGPGLETVRWNVVAPQQTRAQSLSLSSQWFDNEKAQFEVVGEFEGSALGQMRYWVVFDGAADKARSDLIVQTENSWPGWRKLVDRHVGDAACPSPASPSATAPANSSSPGNVSAPSPTGTPPHAELNFAHAKLHRSWVLLFALAVFAGCGLL